MKLKKQRREEEKDKKEKREKLFGEKQRDGMRKRDTERQGMIQRE